MIEAKLQRADILHDHHRNEEALALLNEVISEDPECDEAYFQKAWVFLDMKNRKKEALVAINHAIAIDPEFATYTASKSIILSQLDREKEALTVARSAIEQDSDISLAWVAQATAHGGMNQWAKAETSIRKALELNPDDTTASNLLSVYLRMQGKLETTEAEIQQRLSENAEDDFTHANAGWLALQQGDYAKAETHCMEALRIDSTSEYARSGLLEVYKARSWFYRLYLRWVFFIQKFSEKSQFAIIIIIYIGFRVLRGMAHAVHPGLGFLLGLAFLLFVFGSWIAGGMGHFLILKDRVARHALNAAEKRDGLAVGGMFLIGLLLAVIGLVTSHLSWAGAGGALLASTLPASRVFLNDSIAGRVIFGSAWLASIGIAVSTVVQNDVKMISYAVLLSFLCTWLGMIPALNKTPD